MDMDDLKARGLVLLGCGKMGGSLLEGWLAGDVPAEAVWVLDPEPSDWLRSQPVHLNEGLPERPAVVLVAVKPQIMGEALPGIAQLGGGGTLFLSVAAGITLDYFERALGPGTPIVRSIPNTPAAIGRGITALIPNEEAVDSVELARRLMGAVGQTVLLDDEAQMDAVTAVSGSGPAYVFHLIEALAAAGEAEGLPRDMALALAKATVGGAGQLAEDSDEAPGRLRENVTSPHGTTEAALRVLMDAQTGFPALMRRAVAAAAERSRELGR